MITRKRIEAGFTLLEIVVAMALFGAGIVMVLQLFAGGLRLYGGSRDVSESCIYARQRMEEALLAPKSMEGKEQGDFDEKYRWELSTTVISLEEPKGYEEIRLLVTVRWKDGEKNRSTVLDATRWQRKEIDEGK